MDFLQWLAMQGANPSQAMGGVPSAMPEQQQALGEQFASRNGLAGPMPQGMQPPSPQIPGMRPQLPHMGIPGAELSNQDRNMLMQQGMPIGGMGGMGNPQQPDVRRQLIMQLLQQGMAPQGQGQSQGAGMPAPAPLPMGRQGGGSMGSQPMTGQLMQQMMQQQMGRRPLGM